MPDYYISAVRYQDTARGEKCILEVRTSSLLASEADTTKTKDTVLQDIQSLRNSVMTKIKTSSGTWHEGTAVRVVYGINGKKYLRADTYRTEKDGLDGLPSY
jgi:hypothetical protein